MRSDTCLFPLRIGLLSKMLDAEPLLPPLLAPLELQLHARQRPLRLLVAAERLGGSRPLSLRALHPLLDAVAAVNKIIDSILHGELDKKEYDQDEAKEWSINISEAIKAKVKG